MKLTKTKLDGVFIIETESFRDNRGVFVKSFNAEIFKALGLATNFKENFYSISKKGVIRGMHVQLPPKDHSKLVFVSKGSIIDVVLDIRNGSPTYGKYSAIKLSAKNNKMVYMPPGCAHGFISLEDDSCTVYLQTSTHSKKHDTGIKYDSFGMKWNTKKPIISKRDSEFVGFKKFLSPFKYETK